MVGFLNRPLNINMKNIRSILIYSLFTILLLFGNINLYSSNDFSIKKSDTINYVINKSKKRTFKNRFKKNSKTNKNKTTTYKKRTIKDRLEIKQIVRQTNRVYQNSYNFLSTSIKESKNIYLSPKTTTRKIKIFFQRLKYRVQKKQVPGFKRSFSSLGNIIQKEAPGLNKLLKYFQRSFGSDFGNIIKNIGTGLKKTGILFSNLFSNIKKGYEKNINISKKKKDMTAIKIGYDPSHIKTIDGKIKKEIIKYFLLKYGHLKIKFINIRKNKISEKLKNKEIDIAITENLRFEKNTINISPPIFSEGIYFIVDINEKNKYKYPDSLYYSTIGVKYDSNEAKYLKNRLNISINTMQYNRTDNLITDFKNKKFKVLVLNRRDYYKNLKTLPAEILYSFSSNKLYGHVYFSNIRIYNQFSDFLSKKRNKYEWSDIIYKDPQNLKVINKYFTEKKVKKIVLFFENFGKSVEKFWEK